MGYKVVDHVPKNFEHDWGWTPLLVLEDEYGGQSVVVEDDSCLVLLNGSEDRKFQIVTHWHKEVVLAVVELMQKRAMESVRQSKRPWERDLVKVEG